LKKHDAHEFSIDTPKCVGKRALWWRIGNSELRWNCKVHGRTAARAFAGDPCVIKLRNKCNSCSRGKVAEKTLSKGFFCGGQSPILIERGGGFVPTKTIKEAQGWLPRSIVEYVSIDAAKPTLSCHSAAQE